MTVGASSMVAAIPAGQDFAREQCGWRDVTMATLGSLTRLSQGRPFFFAHGLLEGVVPNGSRIETIAG
jgi:hypothetical protein